MTENNPKTSRLSNRSSYLLSTHTIESKPIETALYLVPTPIGNLADITIRALETLSSADIIACEDTRVTRVLLDRYAIKTKLVTYHEHNSDVAGPKLVNAVKEGKSVALVGDAGTPLISDPGYKLVLEFLDDNLPVISLPGANAPVTALVGAGLPTDSFMFAGFLPTKDKAKRDRLQELSQVPATMMFFESPHRILKTLIAAKEVLGENRKGVVARELTKKFEEYQRGTLKELCEVFSSRERVRGEIVFLLEPLLEKEVTKPEDVDELLLSFADELPIGSAASKVSEITGIAKRTLYQRLLVLKKDGNDG